MKVLLTVWTRYAPKSWNEVFPIREQARHYSRAKCRADFVAALTVSVLSLPQAIGFALIAGIPPQMVIASLVVGGLTAALFNSSRQIVFGPTNTISIFLASIVHGKIAQTIDPVSATLLVGFCIGAVQLAAGVARLGNLTQFLSRSVIIGYTTGVAGLIATAQFASMLGVETPRGTNMLRTLWHVSTEVLTGHIVVPSVMLSIVALGLIFLLQRKAPRLPEGITVLVVVSALAAVFGVTQAGVHTVGDLGALRAQLPPFTGSPLTWETLSVLPEMMNAALAMALLGMMEAISISKTIASKSGQPVNPSQELVGMGMGNLAACMFGAMPGSASFMRSALNHQSGARTQFAALFSSVFIALALLTIVPIANRLPLPVLASVLVVVAFRMINPAQIRLACRCTRADQLVFFATLLGTLVLQLDTAIYVGIGVSLALFIRKASSPVLIEYDFTPQGHLTELPPATARKHAEISIVHVEGDLFFGAADVFETQMRRLAEEENVRVFILRMKNARHLDATAIVALEQLIEYLRRSGRHLLISGVHGEVARVLKRSRLLEKLGRENVFPAEANLTASTRKALIRAQELLQKKHADIRIYYDRERPPPEPDAVPESVA